MNGLRRALLLGLPRLRGRPLLGSGGGGGGGASVLPRRSAASDLWRWKTATIAPLEGEEEEFVFPEYLPENPDAERKQSAPEKERAQPRGAKSEVLPEQTRSERLRQRLEERRRKAAVGGHKVSGRPDPSVPSSGVSCSGCGAELHCQDPAVPGYLPSEKYLRLVRLEEPQLPVEEDGVGPKDREHAKESSRKQQALKDALCQRCWLLVHHRRALQVQMSREEYHNVVSSALRSPPRHGRPHLVLCMVDLLDLPDSILTDLPDLVGSEPHIFVLGNKVDLLPRDSNNYLKRLQEQLREMCASAGLLESGNQRVVDVHLISAKTGYGVEELISKLQRSWKFNGNVFLIGATNSGKSTLFNTLLHSDYCKSRASDAINRATISPWPGTTLNLLKFPIINPTPYRIFRRKERLKADAEKAEEDLSEDEQKQLNMLKKQSYLVGRIGRTFLQTQKQRKNNEIEFDAEALSFSMEEEPYVPSKTATKKIELSYNEVKDARWFHDTPGIVKDGCILNLLNENEIKLVLPTTAIVPRTFILKPGMTLFLGALGRIDYLQGDQSSHFSVVASNLLPVHITTVEKADAIYQKHAGQALLKVPIGEERMKDFPPFVPQDVMLEGISDSEAVADIKLSTAGWVAVTAQSRNKMHLRCYTPKGTTLTVRKPPLLPYIVQIKGERLKGSAAYQTKRPPALVQNLKANVKKKKNLLKH